MRRRVLTAVAVLVPAVGVLPDAVQAASAPTLLVSPVDGARIPSTGVIATSGRGARPGWLRASDGRRLPAGPGGLIWYADLPPGPVVVEWQLGEHTVTAATLTVDPHWRAPEGPVRLEAFPQVPSRWNDHDSGLDVLIDHEVAAVIFIEALLPGRREHVVVATGREAAVPDDCGVIVGVEVLEFDGQRRVVTAGDPTELVRTLYLPRIGQHPERIIGALTLLLLVGGMVAVLRRVLGPDPVDPAGRGRSR